MADISLGEKLPDSTGGDWLAAKAARGVDADFEVQLLAKGFETFDVGLGLVAEAEVFAFVKLVYVKSLLQDFGGEGTGGLAGEIGGERKEKQGIEAGGFEKFEFLRKGGDHRTH